ncbi:hypothetical protein BKA67DRAFT_539585 [Truncatella angustata]|uniref:Uncharacterized protein n=1 Tax=Truncatella angustata TaxID=152316 RepID=A0A9P8UDI7_9PEZI|nr:uncharacterized protein BKA67DRAFT_539585 [Truncatella angustata]KAH6647739.1 hypothetical protein BKA67DRAFT_539585 [Truncatella angustata]
MAPCRMQFGEHRLNHRTRSCNPLQIRCAEFAQSLARVDAKSGASRSMKYEVLLDGGDDPLDLVIVRCGIRPQWRRHDLNIQQGIRLAVEFMIPVIILVVDKTSISLDVSVEVVQILRQRCSWVTWIVYISEGLIFSGELSSGVVDIYPGCYQSVIYQNIAMVCFIAISAHSPASVIIYNDATVLDHRCLVWGHLDLDNVVLVGVQPVRD